MKKKLLYSLFFLGILFSNQKLNAQVYSDWGLSPTGSIYDTITAVSDTLRFQFSNLPAIGYGQVKLTVYFEGDFNNTFEWATVYFVGDSSNSNGPYDSLGQAGPARVANTCPPEDSTGLNLSIDSINAHASSLAIIVIPNDQVGVTCARNRARVRLEYTYCTFGAPVEFASLILTNTPLCPLGGLLPLNGTPAGGTYSGTGTSGTNFDPYGLAAGNYTITYTAADSIGCVSSTTAVVSVDNTPAVADTSACPGPVTLTGSNNSLIWFSDAALTNPLDTGISFTTPPLYQNTSYYVAFGCSDTYFRLDTLLADSINIADNNALVGDDRGGIAVTPQYVYYIADFGAVRYDADMTNPLGGLGTRDGLFSDLSSGELYTLWNSQTNSEPQNNSTNFTVNAIRTLNADLTIGTGMTELSQPIILGNSSYPTNGIFAGAGKLGLYSGISRHFYVVNLCNGIVTDLGLNASPKLRTTESWSMWGIMEYDGTDYSIVYRDSIDNDMHRLVLPAGASTSIGTFPGGIADLACVTYSPWNKNWYFHYEGVSAVLGGTTETTGYANAGDSMSVLPGGTISCAEEVKVSISNVNFGSDTTLCQQNYVLFAGLGYSNYTWNGFNNNFNNYTVTGSDTIIFQGLYQDGCNHLDTLIVTMNPNPVLNLGNDITFCGDTVMLDAGNTGSSFLWSDATTEQTLSAAATGTYIVIVVNGSGCYAIDSIQVTLNPLPVVSLALTPSATCSNGIPVTLTGGLPLGGKFSGNTVANDIFDPASAGTGNFDITYTYTDSLGCIGSTLQNMTVNAAPVVTLGNDITACGDTVVLNSGNIGSLFLWSDASTSQTLAAVASGSYTVTVTDTLGCVSSDSIAVTLNANPVVTLTLNPALVCINWTPFALTGGLPAGGIYSGTAVSNGTFIPSFAGVGTFGITYSYTDSNGCSGSTSQNIVVDACTGIMELTGNGMVSMSPNPGNGIFSLAIKSTDIKEMTIEITDVSGKVVYTENEKNRTGLIKKMDLSYLNEGVYFMKINALEKIQVLKLVIQK